jgi:hypothetical protein
MIVDKKFGRYNAVEYLGGGKDARLCKWDLSRDDGNNNIIWAIGGMSGGSVFCKKRRWGKLQQNLLHGEEEIWFPLLNDVFQGVHV